MPVSQDATSLWYLPASSGEWSDMLAGMAVPTPAHLYLLQEPSGTALDSIGSLNLATSGVTFQQSVTGWTRKSIKTTANSSGSLTNGSYPNVNANSYTAMLVARVSSVLGAGTDPRTLFKLGTTFDDDACIEINRTPRVQVGEGDGTRSIGTTNPTDAVIRYWLRIDDVNNLVDAFQNATKIVGGTQACNGVVLRLGGNNSDSWMPATTDYMYLVVWGSALSDSDIATIDGRVLTGPPTFTVAGNVQINGSPAPNAANVVRVWSWDGASDGDLVDTVDITGGTGSFTCSVFDNTRSYFAVYDDGTNRGVSELGTASVDAFDIAIGSGGSDAVLPTITIIGPPPGSIIGPGTEITFRYSDNIGLRRPMPMAKIEQPDGTFKYELIHDGDNFTPDYSGVKTVIQANPPIIEYKVSRKGGWTAIIPYHGVQSGKDIKLVPFGTDTSGNEPA